jgi:hypothetical protein
MRPAPAAPAAAAVARNLRRFPASGPLLSRPPVRPFIVAPKSMTSPLQPLRPRLGDRHDVRRPILRFEGGARRVEPRPIVVDCIRADLGAVGGKCFVRFTAITLAGEATSSSAFVSRLVREWLIFVRVGREL